MKKLLTLSFLILFGCSGETTEEIVVPEIQKYTLSVSSTLGGTVNTSGGEYAQGTSVTITATPNTGYTFTGWSGNATGTNTSLTIVVNGNISITANFEENIPEYTLSVSSSDGGTVNSSGGQYQQGETITLIATPNTGYSFVNWTNSSGTDLGSNTNLSVTMNSDESISANFQISENIQFANVIVDPGVSSAQFNADYILSGENITIVSKGINLNGDLFTDSSSGSSISISKDELNNSQYTVKFYVQTSIATYESQEYNVTPYSPSYTFSSLSYSEIVGNGGSFSVSYSKISSEASLDISEKGFYVAKSESELPANKYSGFGSGSNLSLDITSLDGGTTYYYQAFITNQYGTYTSEILSFETKYMIGDKAQGGTVIYVDETGYHGLVVADIEYLSQPMQWSDEYVFVGVKFEGSSSVPPDWGKSYSETIYNFFQNNQGSSPAADYCEEIVIDGYSDWFLGNYLAVGRAKSKIDFPSIELWTSMESSYNSDTNAQYHYNTNNLSDKDKKTLLKVIPFRSF